MKKINLFILSVLCMVLAGCGGNSAKSSENNGSVTISLGEASRTIGPNVNWSVSGVEKWNVTFTDKDDSSVYTKEASFTDSRETFTLPVGKYSVSIEGTYTGSTTEASSCRITGSVSEVVIEAGQSKSVAVAVGLAKDGTGTFVYKLNLSESFKVTENMIFAAALADVKSIASLNPRTIIADPDENNSLIFDFGAVDSGFYFITVCYAESAAGEKHFFALNDSLVEIAAGLETTGSCDSSASSVRTKTFYVKHNQTENYNGITPEYPVDFSTAMTWLSENSSKWDFANLYCVETPYNESAENFAPSIDADAVYCTGNQTISYFGYVPDETGASTTGEYCQFWHMSASSITVDTNRTDFNMSLSSEAETGKTVTLDLNNERTSVNTLVLDNVSLTVKNAAAISISEDTRICVIDPKASYNAVMEVEFAGEVSAGIPVLVDESFNTVEGLCIKPVKQSSSEESSNTVYNFYVSSSVNYGISVGEPVPDFEITCENLNEEGMFVFEDKENTKMTFKVSPCSSSSTVAPAFETGTSFEWILNGIKLDASSETIVLDAFKDNVFDYKNGTNHITLNASNEGFSKSAFLSFVVKYEPPVLYYAMWDSNPSTKEKTYYYGTDPSVISYMEGAPTTETSDFETDDSGNVYFAGTDGLKMVSFVDGEWSESILSSSLSDVVLLSRDINTNKLYYMNASGSAGCIDLNSTDKTPVTISRTESEFMNVVTFAAYNDYIYLLTSVDDAEKKTTDYKLIKYKVTFSISKDETGSDTTVAVIGDAEASVLMSSMVSETITDYNTFVSDSDSFKFTDIAVNDSGIFLLIRNVSQSIEFSEDISSAPVSYSRGALVKISEDFSSSEVYGWNKTENLSKYTLTGSSNYYLDTCTGDYSAESMSFFGPQKFVAIKPKQLVIADNGFYLVDGCQFTYGGVKQSSNVVFFDFAGNFKDSISVSSNFGEPFDGLANYNQNYSNYVVTSRQTSISVE